MSAIVATLAILHGPAAATETSHVAGWQIDRESTSCSMRKQDADRGIFGIVFGLDEDGDADTRIDQIDLLIADNQYRNKVAVELEHVIGGRRFPVRAQPNINSPFVGTFVTPVGEDYVALLATAPNSLVVGADGKYLFGISLRGYGEALAALKTCIKQVETEYWRGRDGW